MSKQQPKFYISEEEIEDRAKSVIILAKDNNMDAVINIFELISLPFSGENFKKQIFCKIFDLANIEYEWSEELGFFIPSENRTKRAVVSHMDLITKFNNGFSNGQFYKIEDEKLIGALDNTFTNAVVINSILNKRKKDTSYLFTLDEETTQYAIRNYMKMYGSEQFIVNLDVTNDGKKYNMSIEYDEPCFHICKQIQENMDNPYFTTDRVGDDFDEVIKADGFGFSYCLPTEKTIHSYKNFTYLSKIEPYMKGLDFLVHKLDISNINENIRYLDLKDALKHESFESMKEKDIYIAPEQPKRISDYSSHRYKKESKHNCYSCGGIFTTPTKIDDVYLCPYCYEEVLAYKEKKNKDGSFEDLVIDLVPDYFRKDMKVFTNHYLSDNELFSEKDLSQEVFYSLLNYGVIKNTYQDLYFFDEDDVSERIDFKIYSVFKKFPQIESIEIFKMIYDRNLNLFSLDDLIDYVSTSNPMVLTKAIKLLEKKKLIKPVNKKGAFKII